LSTCSLAAAQGIHWPAEPRRERRREWIPARRWPG